MARHQYQYRRPPRRRIRFSQVLFTIIIAGMLVYPFLEANRLTVDNHIVQVAGLVPNLRNLKIVFASDIHQGRFFPQARVNQLIQKINALSPDIVILGGDYAQSSESAIAFFQNAPRIQARLGVYGVVGASDRTEPESNFTLLVAEMKNYGCLPLVNNVAKVKVGQTYAYVAGVDDYENGIPKVAEVAGQLSRDDFVIFAAHNPDLLEEAFAAKSMEGVTHWFDLALFGATHGGQVTLFGRPVLPGYTPEMGLRYLTGWKEENRASILISNGVGVGNLPIRLFAAPQIHSIVLKSK